jgi:hypothetical protein
MLGDDGNQIGAHSALLAASKQSEDGRIPHLNGSFPVFILGWTSGENSLNKLLVVVLTERANNTGVVPSQPETYVRLNLPHGGTITR